MLLIVAVRLRKRWDRPRRAALDQGWVIPDDAEDSDAGEESHPLDPSGPKP